MRIARKQIIFRNQRGIEDSNNPADFVKQHQGSKQLHYCCNHDSRHRSASQQFSVKAPPAHKIANNQLLGAFFFEGKGIIFLVTVEIPLPRRPKLERKIF